MKILELRKELARKKIELAIFYQGENKDPNVVYFTGYSGYGFLIVPARDSPVLLVPRMELSAAKRTGVRSFALESGLSEAIKRIYGRRPKRVGVDESSTSAEFYGVLRKKLGARLISLTDVCRELRATKTKREIETIRKACVISDSIFNKCLKNFRKFRYETDVSSFMQNEAAKLGLELSFRTIVGSGKNSSIVHHEPERTKLKRGFCVIDFGIKYKNYCTDTTRTVYLGRPSKKEREIYDTVLSAQLKAISELKNGKGFSAISDAASRELGKYSKQFTHSLGHGIGIEVHERPSISPRSKDRIREGMVFAIEPGIYFDKKFGIRIEDDVLMTRRGPVVLTRCTKKLVSVGLKNV